MTVRLHPVAPAQPTGHAVPEPEPESIAQMSLDQIALPAAPIDHGVLPTISYSSLSRFGRCSYRFHLERELRLPENADDPLLVWSTRPGAEGTIDPASRGSIVHAALESADLGGGARADRPGLQALAAEWAGGEVSEDAIDDLVEVVDAALTAPLMERVAAAQARQAELSFVLDLGGDELPLLNGTIDLLATERDGAALVVDYKTDRVRDGDDVEDLVAARYSLQRQVYAAAVLASGIKRVDVAYLFTERPEQPAIASYTQDDLAGLRTVLARLCHELRFAARRPTSDPKRFTCAGCPARLGLCPYSDVETSR